MRLGVTRTLFRASGPRVEGKERQPVEVTGRTEPLPMTILGGLKEVVDEVRIPECIAM
jgi:hypothetical protein